LVFAVGFRFLLATKAFLIDAAQHPPSPPSDSDLGQLSSILAALKSPTAAASAFRPLFTSKMGVSTNCVGWKSNAQKLIAIKRP
jgi:hypothetical protein